MGICAQDPEAPLEPKNMVGASSYPASFLSMDVDGRVVRLDSVSKFLAPGFRLGFVTCSKAMLAKWQILAEVTTWSVSGFQQDALMSTMQKLGDDGLHEHLQRLQCTYAQRRNH